jgi:hypothetical protein
MYTPIEKAPPDFMKRYNAIMSGEEKLDTPQKLKGFWLFAIGQGWKSYEMREYIALLVETADWESPIIHKAMRKSWFSRPTIWIVHDDFRSFKAMKPAPFPNEQTDEKYLDEQWNKIEFDINRVSIAQDKK